MKTWQIMLVLVLPSLLASKTDPLASIQEPDRTVLKSGIARYAKDELSQKWVDLFEIADQDGTKARDDRFTESTVPLTREAFARTIQNDVANGGTPVLTSFELTEVKLGTDGYDVRACAAAKRENFHYKGIIQFRAIVRGDSIRFGPWSYIVSMPHSCSQKDN